MGSGRILAKSPVPQNKPSSATNISIGAHLLIEIFRMMVIQRFKAVASQKTWNLVVRIVHGHVHHCGPQRLMFTVCIPHFPRSRKYSCWALCQIVFQCIQHIGEPLVLVTSNTWLILYRCLGLDDNGIRWSDFCRVCGLLDLSPATAILLTQLALWMMWE